MTQADKVTGRVYHLCNECH